MANQIKVGKQSLVPTTREDVDALLEAYKEVNPAKYKTKEANGEFEKLYAKVGEEPKKEEVKEEPKEEKPKKKGK